MTNFTAGQLFAWPVAAKFGRRVPKEKFYERGSVSRAVRESFVAEVASIEWAYKLAESTINLPGSSRVPEIQVLRIEAKHDDVGASVLTAIDAAIPSPLIFEIVRNDGATRMTTAVKKSGRFHSTGWVRAAQQRAALPTAINLDGLYAQLLEALMRVTGRAGESIEDLAARTAEIAQLERLIAATERRQRNEKQLNRKLELRRELNALQNELEEKQR